MENQNDSNLKLNNPNTPSQELPHSTNELRSVEKMDVLEKTEENKISDSKPIEIIKEIIEVNQISLPDSNALQSDEQIRNRLLHPRPENEEEIEIPQKRFKSSRKKVPEEKSFSDNIEVTTLLYDKNSPPAKVGEEVQKKSDSKGLPSTSPMRVSVLKKDGSKSKVLASVSNFEESKQELQKSNQKENIESKRQSTNKKSSHKLQEESRASHMDNKVEENKEENKKQPEESLTEPKKSKRDKGLKEKENLNTENQQEKESENKREERSTERRKSQDKKKEKEKEKVEENPEEDEDFKEYFKKSASKKPPQTSRKKRVKSKTPDRKKSKSKSKTKTKI
jgi:hypothetical protein